MNTKSAPRAASHPIRAVALVQLGIATLCALVFAVPSAFFLGNPITLCLIVFAWGAGGYLITQYWAVATRATTARATLRVWIQNIAFNAGGFGTLIACTTLLPSSGLDSVIGATALPAALGTLCGLLGMAMALTE